MQGTVPEIEEMKKINKNKLRFYRPLGVQLMCALCLRLKEAAHAMDHLGRSGIFNRPTDTYPFSCTIYISSHTFPGSGSDLAANHTRRLTASGSTFAPAGQ